MLAVHFYPFRGEELALFCEGELLPKGYLHTERYCLRSLILALAPRRAASGSPGSPFQPCAPVLALPVWERFLACAKRQPRCGLPVRSPPQSFSRLFSRTLPPPQSFSRLSSEEAWVL